MVRAWWVFATAVAVLAMGGGEPGLAATQVHVPVDCGTGANLQAAIDAAPKRAVLEISGTCRGTFSVGKTLALRGSPTAVLDGQQAGTTLTITGGQVHAFDLTITGGRSSDAGGVLIVTPGTFRPLRGVVVTGNVGGLAGGIVNRGTLVIARSRVANNAGPGILTEGIASVDTSTVRSNSGTGIRVESGEAFIRDSTIDDNTSTSGAGGIQIDAGATTPVLARSTIAQNASTSDSAGGIGNAGSLTIISSTVAANDSQAGVGGIESSGDISMRGTILATNTQGGTARSDCGGSLGSGGYNLVGTTAHPVGSLACSFSAVSTDLIGASTPIDPMLKVLGSYGGKTQTMVPRPASPAVNAIPIGAPGVLCASGQTDQRGIPRPQGGACDIGSVERKPKE
jgi:hypothetical protein